MELHSYAKRRAAKKWAIDQKRKLVETRIKYDAMFYNKPTASVMSWKKILNLAKLDEYNVFFVRKQWSNMVAKYKQYKQNRLGNIPPQAIDDDMIRHITQEWEFFQPLHRFMSHKTTTNLHSYALTTIDSDPEPLDEATAQTEQKSMQLDTEQQQQQQHSCSSAEPMNIFSSDTNEDYAVEVAVITNGDEIYTNQQNTDHDFYSKKTTTTNNQQLCYFADASEDTQESARILLEPAKELIVETNGLVMNGTTKEDPIQQEQKPTTSTKCKTNLKGTKKQTQLSEREKYYRHKRRFNHRLERRCDSILNVFGQIVKAEYPSIDVSALLDMTASVANSTLVNRLFSSDEEDGDSTDDKAE